MPFWRWHGDDQDDTRRVLDQSNRERQVVGSAVADLRRVLEELEGQLENDAGRTARP